MADFLLELGVEEIPDWMIVPALDHLNAVFSKLLGDARLGGAVTLVDATPRRLVLQASGLAGTQPDAEDLISGPPKSSGAGAAQGFARKNGVTVDDLETVTTPKGEYFAFRRKTTGKPAAEILSAALPAMLLNIPWPKAMYWTTKASPRFIRPIRWALALLDGSVVRFEIAGVVSGNVSKGHRRFGASEVEVSIGSYAETLRANHVLVYAAERRARIEDGIALLLAGKGLRVKADAALLDTLTYLTEWPAPVLGTFDEAYLSLPSEVLVTVMRHHQKYFSVEREDGSLANHFVAVMNVPGDPEGFIVSGNERVLRARFNDARFFWDVDQHRTLADRVDSLAQVTYQARLGSYLDKTRRNVALVGELGGGEDAQRAALLAKCDLTTDMVKEFTDLQGVVGGLYARAQGERETVARAIYEHYKPLSMDDSIPASEAGRLVSLADKLDTLRECFRIGMVPSGSRDPFALRRAAQGVVKILVEGGISTPLCTLLGRNKELEDFFLDRVRYYFREIRGYAYDEVNAVVAAGWDNLPDAASRLEAIQAVRPTENFEPLAASFKRIRNILELAKFEGGAIDPALLSDDAERALHQAISGLNLTGLGHREALESIASLRPAVDHFFDRVLVNAPEPQVRANRLALLDTLRREFSRIADFSEIVTSAN